MCRLASRCKLLLHPHLSDLISTSPLAAHPIPAHFRSFLSFPSSLHFTRSFLPAIAIRGGFITLGLPSAGVILLMDFAQARVRDVGIDLRRVNRGVAKHLLHRADVSAIGE